MASSVGTSPAKSPSLDEKLMHKTLLRGTPSDTPIENWPWSSRAKRAKSVCDMDLTVLQEKKISKENDQQCSSYDDESRGCQNYLDLHKGLQAIASSLSLLSDTLGTAIEEGHNLVEAKDSGFKFRESQSLTTKNINAVSSPDKLQVDPVEKPGLTRETQLKSSHDVAMAMSTKAKLLLRELKRVKADLAYTRDRCAQLEEENKRLRESLDKGVPVVTHEEDDLVRLQLETLLAEKARLAQENANYARENQFLHEVVQYHRLTLRDSVLLDESFMEAAEVGFDGPAVDSSWNLIDGPVRSWNFMEEQDHPHPPYDNDDDDDVGGGESQEGGYNLK
eukprot:c343_g1_i2 orf=112-1116(+)